MQAKTLKQPGRFASAERLRREVANAISIVEVAKAQGAVGDGALLSTFLSDAASKTPNATAPVLPATQVIVSNGATVNVENSAGALDSAGTATVQSGVLTSVQLAATKTILTNALKFGGVTITGTGTFFTPTIVNGVLTGGVLSES